MRSIRFNRLLGLSYGMALILGKACCFQYRFTARRDLDMLVFRRVALLGHVSLAENPGSRTADIAMPPSNSSTLAYNLTPGERRKFTWNERVMQLQEFIKVNRHTSVPKRYTDHGNLGLWVAKQRLHYRKYMRGESSPLTTRQIEILDSLGFCWEASIIKRQKVAPDDRAEPESDWWKNYHRLRSQLELSGEKRVGLLTLSSDMVQWLKRQKKDLDQVNILDHDLVAKQHVLALEKLDPAWTMSRRDLQWETRYDQLLDYHTSHGHYNIPISFENKELANWVSNQRKQYNLLQRKKPSLLTPQRRQRLDAIGFVWNRWDDAFAQKQVFRN